MNPTLAALLFPVAVYAQANPAYQAPRRIDFANVNVQLDESARKLVQADINALIANRNSLNNRLERAVLYFPIVEEVFDKEKIPDDFKYLVLQESGLVPDAVSTSNAVGFWQFKRETAGDFKLRVDDEVDERKNIHAATWAAAQYLKRSNGVLDNWVSTLFSYYLGLGGVRQLLPPDWTGAREVQVTDKTDRYILRCLAHKIVFESELQAFRSPKRQRFYEYTGCAGKTFRDIAAELQVDEVELRRYNRWVGTSRVPDDKEYTMLVPVTVEQYAAVRSRAKAANLAPRPTLDATDAVPAVMVASVTGNRPDAPRPAASRPAARPAGRKPLNNPGYPKLRRITPVVRNQTNVPIYYEINGKRGIMAQQGDTYQTIAKRANIKPAKFLKFNELSEQDGIVPGQVYYLKKKWKTADVPEHVLEEGQSAWQVAHRYGMRLEKLMSYNRVETASALVPGRVLWLQQTRPSNRPAEVRNLPGAPAGTPAADVAQNTRTPEAPVRETPAAGTASRPSAESDVRVVDAPPSRSSGNSRVTMVPEGSGSAPTTRPQPTAPAPRPAPAESAPVSRPAPAPSIPERRVATPSATALTHRVVQGETFYAVARKYGMTPQELRDLNGFSDYPAVKIGQTLRVAPGPGAPEPTAPAPSRPTADAASGWITHTVVQGETFYAIARKYDVSPQDLRDWNGFTEYPTVKIGQKLKIKR
jgi:membrane-bound lytic murein transglycosylase D